MKKLGHKLHIYISAFFLPVALMYAITGVLYIFGIDEDIGAITNKYTIDMTPNENKIDILTDYLKNNNIKIPSDTTPKNTKNGGISIGGIYYSARINEVDNKYEITTIQRSIYGAMVLLHKSKGGYYFDIMAVGFSIAIIILYFTGFIITSFCKNRRKEAVVLMSLGLITSVILAILSV